MKSVNILTCHRCPAIIELPGDAVQRTFEPQTGSFTLHVDMRNATVRKESHEYGGCNHLWDTTIKYYAQDDGCTDPAFDAALEAEIAKRPYRISDESDPYAIGANNFRKGARWAFDFLRPKQHG